MSLIAKRLSLYVYLEHYINVLLNELMREIHESEKMELTCEQNSPW